MSDDIGPLRRCPHHGFFGGGTCPDCGAPGKHVLHRRQRRRLSKMLSGALRHFPEEVGLSLDEEGWVPLDALADAASEEFLWADRAAVEGVIETDPKGRYERREPTAEAASGGETAHVRAAYGHSVDVDVAGDTDADALADRVPDELYHGTSPDAADWIREEGIKPMERQGVHLSPSVADAEEVGRRHAEDPVVFAVDAAGLLADGHRVERRGDDVYVAPERIPSDYVRPVEE
jgi:putative RNA 2'-phosphotransferase